MNIFIKKLIDPRDKNWFTYILFRQGEFSNPIATLTESEVKRLLENVNEEIRVK